MLGKIASLDPIAKELKDCVDLLCSKTNLQEKPPSIPKSESEDSQAVCRLTVCLYYEIPIDV